MVVQKNDPAYAFGFDMDAGHSAESMAQPGGSLRCGQAQLQKVLRTRRFQPEVIVAAHEEMVKQELGVAEGGAWTWRRYGEEQILPHCGNFTTLKRLAVILTRALDEGRQGSLMQQHAFLAQAISVVEGAAKDPAHDLGWGWPLLGVADPGERPIPHLPIAESAAIASFHKEQKALNEARKSLSKSGGEAHAGAASSGSAGDGATSAAFVKKLVKEEMAAAKAKGKGKKGDED